VYWLLAAGVKDNSVTLSDSQLGTDNTATASITVTCPLNQASHQLTANTNIGTITGLFCVNPSTGIGTYTQLSPGSVTGTGFARQGFGATQIAAFGTNLNLAGNQFGAFNRFAETAPVSAIGTFSLS
jgi:hypothetical protein